MWSGMEVFIVLWLSYFGHVRHSFPSRDKIVDLKVEAM
jgi:hypothetical protein